MFIFHSCMILVYNHAPLISIFVWTSAKFFREQYAPVSLFSRAHTFCLLHLLSDIVTANFTCLLCLKDQTSSKNLQKESLKTIEKWFRNKSSKSGQQLMFSVLVVPLFHSVFQTHTIFVWFNWNDPLHQFTLKKMCQKMCNTKNMINPQSWGYCQPFYWCSIFPTFSVCAFWCIFSSNFSAFCLPMSWPKCVSFIAIKCIQFGVVYALPLAWMHNGL